jgi:hypothetical protein
MRKSFILVKSDGFSLTNTQPPKNKILSIGGGNSYLFSCPAFPFIFPYIAIVFFSIFHL